jgi:hypothetical protein
LPTYDRGDPVSDPDALIAIAQVAYTQGDHGTVLVCDHKLLGAEQTGLTSVRGWLSSAALVLGVLLMVEIMVMWQLVKSPPQTATLLQGFGSPLSVGEILFSHVLPFDGTLDLAAHRHDRSDCAHQDGEK